MDSELSKDDVLNLLRIWNNWMKGPDPANNKPDEFKLWDEYMPNGFKFAFGIFLHLFLWFLVSIGLNCRVPSLAVWASKTSIKHDDFWWEPISCGMNNSYTDMGLGYLNFGKTDKAIECLSKSWQVYPCPHNTTYGLKLKLFKKLRDYPEAKNEVTEYLEMWERFKRT